MYTFEPPPNKNIMVDSFIRSLSTYPGKLDPSKHEVESGVKYYSIGKWGSDCFIRSAPGVGQEIYVKMGHQEFPVPVYNYGDPGVQSLDQYNPQELLMNKLLKFVTGNDQQRVPTDDEAKRVAKFIYNYYEDLVAREAVEIQNKASEHIFKRQKIVDDLRRLIS